MRCALQSQILSSFPPITASDGRGFMDHYLAEAGALRNQLIPYPYGKILKRRILKSVDFIQVPVVELLDDFPGRLADLRVIVKPAHFRIDLPLDGNLKAETVAVHPPAFMPGRHMRQHMG